MRQIVWRQLRALIGLSLLDLYRRRDVIVLFLLGALVISPLIFVAPFGITGAGRYVDELALLLLWLASGVIAIGVAARQFPPEFEQRTIYPLQAKPVARTTLLLGKFLGATLAALSALTLFYLAYLLLAGARQGHLLPLVLLQAYLLHVAFMVVVVALVMLGSLLLTPAANITLSTIVIVAMLLFGQRLPALAATQPSPINWLLIAADWLAPHVEFFDLRQRLIHLWPPLSWPLIGMLLCYALGYTLLSLALAARLLKRRQL